MLAEEIDELAAANEEQTSQVTEIAELVESFGEDSEVTFDASRN